MVPAPLPSIDVTSVVFRSSTTVKPRAPGHSNVYRSVQVRPEMKARVSWVPAPVTTSRLTGGRVGVTSAGCPFPGRSTVMNPAVSPNPRTAASTGAMTSQGLVLCGLCLSCSGSLAGAWSGRPGYIGSGRYTGGAEFTVTNVRTAADPVTGCSDDAHRPARH